MKAKDRKRDKERREGIKKRGEANAKHMGIRCRLPKGRRRRTLFCGFGIKFESRALQRSPNRAPGSCAGSSWRLSFRLNLETISESKRKRKKEAMARELLKQGSEFLTMNMKEKKIY